MAGKVFQMKLDPELHNEARMLIYNLKYSKDPFYGVVYEKIKDNPTRSISELHKELRNKDKRHVREVKTLINIATKCGLKYTL